MSLVFENTNVACTVIFKEKKGPGYKTVRVNEVYILTLSTTRRECADRLRAVVPGDGPEAGFLASSWCLSNFLTVNINCFYRQNSNNKPQYREVMSRSLWFRPRQRAEGRLAQAAPYPQGAGPGRLLGSSGMVRSVLWPSGWGGGAERTSSLLLGDQIQSSLIPQSRRWQRSCQPLIWLPELWFWPTSTRGPDSPPAGNWARWKDMVTGPSDVSPTSFYLPHCVCC